MWPLDDDLWLFMCNNFLKKVFLHTGFLVISDEDMHHF